LKHRDFSQLATLLAEHTAAPTKTKPTVAKVRKPANDNKPAAEVLAWPALERLAYRGDKARVDALQRWRYFVFPRETVVVDQDETQYEPELFIEVRPSEAELMAAVGRHVTDRERWDHTGEMVNVYSDAPDPKTEYSVKLVVNDRGVPRRSLEAKIGNLIFCDGELTQWGATSKGKALKPVNRNRGAKGGEKTVRSDTAIWSYLALKGAVSPLTSQPYIKPISTEKALPPMYDPLPPVARSKDDKIGRYGVERARAVLIALGIDGKVRFEDLPLPATRGPDCLAKGSLWLGGVKMPKENTSTPAPREPEMISKAEAVSYAEYLRSRLGRHAAVLDMAITHASSAAEIGVAMGLAPAYATKRGGQMIDEAIDALITLLETLEGEIKNNVIDEIKIAA